MPFLSKLRRLGAASLLAALVVLPASPSAGVAAAPRSNVLLISIDSLRRDFLGCYGATLPYAHGLSPTPSLDRLAAAGVRLADAYSPSSWTLPAHVSLMTGLSPIVHGVETDLQTLDPTTATLAGVLHANGYQTAGVFSGPYLEASWGFGRGFDRYTAAYGTTVADASRGLARFDDDIARATAKGDDARAEALLWERRALYERVRKLSHADVSSERVTATALAELTRLGADPKPWFLFVHYFDVHYDYVPPPPYLTRFDPDYRGGLDGRGFLENPQVAVPDAKLADGWIRHASARDTEHLMALCAGETAWVDQHVAQVLAKLTALGQDSRTLVVVVSDHGDEFFEHGGIGHRRTLHEELTHIPLLLRLPGVLPAGAVIPGRVSLSDVYPTILDLLDLTSPAPVTGRTMVPLIRGIDDAEARMQVSRLVRLFDGEVHLDAEHPLHVQLATVQEAFWWNGIKIFRTRRWPLFPPFLGAAQRAMLRTAADEEFRAEDLYWIDLGRHPDEPPRAFSKTFDDPRAQAALEAFRTRYRALRARRRALLVSATERGRSHPIDAELRSKLEGLGYATTADEAAPRSPRHGFVLPPPGETRSRAPR